MAGIPLPFPIKGLDESGSFSEQPTLTSRDILNMRAEDPYTGRVRGAQRSGLSKFTSPSATIGTGKVQHGASTIYDSRNVTYSAISPPSGARWSNTLPSGFSARAMKCGRQSDVYVIDGPAALVKYNNAGVEQWKVSLPVQDPLHFCRALAVDDVDNVYVGVSEGGDQEKARIFKVVQDFDGKVHVDDTSFAAWVITPGAFIEDMHFQQGKLYTIQNLPDRWGARMVAYTALGTATPQIAWQHGKDVGGDEIAYPVNSLAVKKNGDYAISSEPFVGRSQGDPRFPLNSPVLEDWTPKLLTNYQDRVWAWLTPDDLDLNEDDEVDFWADRSGNDRNLFKHIDLDAPRYNRVGIAGRPSIRFAGSEALVAGAGQALQSEPNTSTARDFADQQKTILPSYTGATDAEKAMFALFIVARPYVTDTPNAPATYRTLLGQSITGTTYSNELFIAFNRNESNAGGVPVAGSVCIFDSVSAGGGGTDGRPDNAIISTASIQAAVISLLHDGGRTAANPKSLWRLNGTGVDRWDSNARSTLLPTEIGAYAGQTTFGKYQGDLGDIFVLRDYASATDGLLSHPYAPDGGGDSSGDSEIERIEGWIAWKYGLSHILNTAHPFYRTKGPPRAGGVAQESKKLLLLSENGIVAKYGAGKGNLKWVVTARVATGIFSAVACSGIGYGIATDEDGNFYTTGPRITTGGAAQQDNAVMRKIIDNGDSATISAGTTSNNSPTPSHATSAWSKTSIDITGDGSLEQWTYKYPRLACDTFSNIYVPWHQMNTVASRSVTVWDKTGAYHLSGAYAAPSGGPDGYSVAVDPQVPDYDDDFPGGSVGNTARAEYFYLGVASPGAVAHSVRFSQVATETGSPRTAVHVAVVGGAIKRFTDAAVSAIAGSGTLAEPQLDAASQFISSTVHSSKLYFVDGKNYRVFDPREDTVTEWKATSGGAIPPRCKLITTWRSRIVLARGVDDPQNWHMSAFSNPLDWDQFPAAALGSSGLPTQAISGNNALAGQPPDIINTLMPWSDDILDFGCDRSIWRLTGDPMAGGQLDSISDTIGVAFGPSWCRSDSGEQFFFSSEGGVYLMGYPPRPLTEGRIDRELRDFDFSAYYPVLVWNKKDQGLHVFQVPYGAGGTLVRHWFWSKRTGGWFPDEIGLSTSTGAQPTSAWIIDGDDPSDRTLLLGCEDGYVRRWDENARTDDGTVIEARALLGPFSIGPGKRARFTRLAVQLADDQSGCRFELMAHENPETIGLPVIQGAFNPGQNYAGVRAAGNFATLMLRNAQQNTRFAYERGQLEGYPAGRARERLRG